MRLLHLQRRKSWYWMLPEDVRREMREARNNEEAEKRKRYEEKLLQVKELLEWVVVPTAEPTWWPRADLYSSEMELTKILARSSRFCGEVDAIIMRGWLREFREEVANILCTVSVGFTAQCDVWWMSDLEWIRLTYEQVEGKLIWEWNRDGCFDATGSRVVTSLRLPVAVAS